MSIENDIERLYQLTLAQNISISAHGEFLAKLEQGQKDLCKQLLGNGQPGKLQIIEARLASNEDTLSQHGKKFAWFAGVSSAIGFIITVVGTFLHFHHH